MSAQFAYVIGQTSFGSPLLTAEESAAQPGGADTHDADRMLPVEGEPS